jgi:hypothetical protein
MVRVSNTVKWLNKFSMKLAVRTAGYFSLYIFFLGIEPLQGSLALNIACLQGHVQLFKQDVHLVVEANRWAERLQAFVVNEIHHREVVQVDRFTCHANGSTCPTKQFPFCQPFDIFKNFGKVLAPRGVTVNQVVDIWRPGIQADPDKAA